MSRTRQIHNPQKGDSVKNAHIWKHGECRNRRTAWSKITQPWAITTTRRIMQPWRKQALRQTRRRTSTDKRPARLAPPAEAVNRKCSITSSISYGPGDAPQPAEDPEAVKKLQSGNDPPGRNPKRRGIWPPSDTRGTDADMSTTPDRAAAQ